MTEQVPFVKQRYEPGVPLTALHPNPRNPNEGDVGLLCELFDANGFAGAVMAQEGTGILIDGETRWRAAEAKGVTHIPVIWCDVDDETRDRMLAEWNESTRRGVNNQQKLLDLLTYLQATPRGLEGAVFDGDDVDDLLNRLNQPLHIGGAPTGAAYAESDEDQAARQQRNEGYADRKEGGTLVEMILVYSTDQREEVSTIMDQIRTAIGVKDERASDVILRALRVTNAVLMNEDEQAKSIATWRDDA